MLKKKTQEKYLEKRSQEILALLEGFGVQEVQETLHALRVQVKKINAFLQLSAVCSHKQKLPKTVKEMFKHAGSIRTAYLNMQFLQKYQAGQSQFKMEQEETMTLQTVEFAGKLSRYRKAVKKIPRHFDKLQDIKKGCINDWYKTEIDKTQRSFESFPGDQLHASRKIIKNFMYVHEMLTKAGIAGLNLNIGYLDKLQEVIGKWHDVEDAAKLIASKETIHKKTRDRFQGERMKLLALIEKLCKRFSVKLALPLTGDK